MHRASIVGASGGTAGAGGSVAGRRVSDANLQPDGQLEGQERKKNAG
jgi:hypothetical protein